MFRRLRRPILTARDVMIRISQRKMSGLPYGAEHGLVTCEWLKSELESQNGNIKVLDGTYPSMMNVRNAFEKERIPGSAIFDISKICAPGNNMCMAPEPTDFADAVGKLGVSDKNTVVIYDRTNKFLCAPRVWWMFKLFGHSNVAVLEGGFPRWKELGFALDSGVEGDIEPTTYNASFKPELVRTLDSVVESCKNGELEGNVNLVDTRGKFQREPNTPKINREGAIPFSVMLPFADVLQPGKSEFLPKENLLKIFDECNLSKDGDKPIVSSCGGGITSCTVALALDLCGYKNVSVYDGSYGEWASSDKTNGL
eukprot:25296_1